MNPYEELLLRHCQNSGELMVLTAENRGHLRTVPPFLGDRFIDVGIAEQTMIGMAAGMAMRGRTVVTHALAAFITMRSYEFIRDDVGIPNASVIMVGMVPGVLSDGNGPTHQAIEDVAIMRGIPNIGVFCPCDIDEFVEGMDYLITDGRPYYVRYIGMPASFVHTEPFIPGVAEVLHTSDAAESDVTILTYGYMCRIAHAVIPLLEAKDIRVRLVNMRTLKPVDERRIIEELQQSQVVVTLEDHLSTGGLFSIVAEVLLRNHPEHHARVLPIALSSWFKPGRLQEVLAHEGLDPIAIAARIETYITTHVQEHGAHE
jgi:transketolase